MSVEPNSKPIASGNFSQKPFSHILVFILERKMGGSLRVNDGHQQVDTYFRDGTPAKVSSTFPGRNLGHILRVTGSISHEQLESAEREIEQKGGLLGQVLISQGTIVAPTLVKALQKQMLLKLTDVFSMVNGDWAFYEKVDLLRGFGSKELLPIDTFPVLMSGMRTHGFRMNFAGALKALEGKWISTREPDTIRRFRLKASEKALLEELLVEPQSFDNLINTGTFDVHMVSYILYVLMITRLLIVEEKGPDVTTTEEAKIRAGQLDSVNPAPFDIEENPKLVKVKQNILEKAAQIASENYYEMLGLAFGAPHEEVRTAYFRLAKIYHPDKVPKPVAIELKDTLQYIFSNITEAHATLIDPDAREEYETAIKDSEDRTSVIPQTDDEEEVRGVLQAETFYQKSLVFLKRGQSDKALQMVEKARALNPVEGEYSALWAFLKGKSRPLTESVDDLIELLRKAVASNPKSERANLFFAQMLKRAGNMGEAKRHFSLTVEINPRNIEAARELRLMEMREKKNTKGGSGIFKRLFKKDAP